MFALKLLKTYFAVFVTTAQLSTLYERYSPIACAQPISVLKTRTAASAPLCASITKQAKLFSRTRMFLQIDQNGKVGGTSNCSSQFVQLEISSVGTGLVRIKGVKSGRYLAMNSAGDVYSTANINEETQFKNVLQTSGYHTFASNKYFQQVFDDAYFGLRRNGIPKNGNRSNRLQKTVQFLMITSTNC